MSNTDHLSAHLVVSRAAHLNAIDPLHAIAACAAGYVALDIGCDMTEACKAALLIAQADLTNVYVLRPRVRK